MSFSKFSQNPAVSSVVGKILDVIVIPLVQGLFVLTFLIFVWGLFNMITKGGDPTARTEGQKHILWGVVGMAIMVSVYGIIRLIGYTTIGTDPFN
ncbi:MAG: hypothetical protein AAB909_03410 [Patescibacteria group bacterium]